MEHNKTEKLLTSLMERGYTVDIEAKGRGREFEMSYEVYTSIEPGLPLIAFGKTLDEALESLIRQIKEIEKLKQETR